MEKEIVLKYIELALKNLYQLENMRFNVEAEVSRLMNRYTAEEISELVPKTAYTPIKNPARNWPDE